jgi:hypothetical protein
VALNLDNLGTLFLGTPVSVLPWDNFYKIPEACIIENHGDRSGRSA